MRRNWRSVTLVAMTLAVVTFVPGSEGSNNKAAPKCPKIDPIDRTIHLPHEWDCTKFYKCDHGTPVLFQCPLMDHDGNRLHFNPALEVCDWPQNAGCVQGTEPTTGNDITTQPTTSQSSSRTVSSSSTEKTTAMTGNDDNRPSTTLSPPGTDIPHENNCSLYYEVANGERKLKECPQGFHFSPWWLTCMKAEDAGCDWTTAAQQTTASTHPVCGRPCGDINDGWFIPHECSCDKYYQCSNGDLIRHQCAEGLHFNPKLATCDYPESAGCEITTPRPTTIEPTTSIIPSECPPGNSGHTVQIPHPTNCSLFYNCDNGEKHLMQCPDGLHFNPTIQMCDYPQSAGCTATSGTTEGTDETSTSAATTAMTSTEASKPTVTTVSTSNSASTSQVPTECPKGNTEPPVSLPHPYNCSLYYTCDDGEKVVHSCPSGLEFNPRKQKCDWPESAGCVALTTEATSTTIQSSGSSTTVQMPSSSPSSTRTPGTTEGPTTTQRSTSESSTRPPGTTSSSSTTQRSTETASTSQSSTRTPGTTESSTTTQRSTSESATRPPGTTPNSSTTQRSTETPSTSQSSTRTPGTTENPRTTQRSTAQSSTKTPGTTESSSTTRRSTETASTSQSSTRTPGTTESSSTTRRSTETASTSQSSTRTPGTTPSSSTTRRSTETAGTSKATTSSATSEHTTAKLTTSSAESTDSTSSNSDAICPPDMDGHQVPHETNCSLYYECKDGEKILRECTPGLQFSAVLELCVWPENAGCESTTDSPWGSSAYPDDSSTEEPPSSPSGTTSNSEEVTDSTIDPGTGSCIGTCPKKDPQDYTVMLPHKDCTKFCKCSNTKPYVYDCPTGLHFSPTKRVCDYPKRAKCEGKGGYGQPANEA